MSRKRNRPDRHREAARGRRSAGAAEARVGTGHAPARAASARRVRPARPRIAGARRLLTITAIAAALLLTVALAVVARPGQTDAGQWAPDRHSRGDPRAPVTITEWSDFL